MTKKIEILPLQIWKSNYADIYYRVFGGSTNDVEIYDVDNPWDSKVVSKTDMYKHFVLHEDPVEERYKKR